jgi:hypothetical protein
MGADVLFCEMNGPISFVPRTVDQEIANAVCTLALHRAVKVPEKELNGEKIVIIVLFVVALPGSRLRRDGLKKGLAILI